MIEQSIPKIADTAIYLLRHKGVLIENTYLLSRLAEYGASVEGETAYFPSHLSTSLLEQAHPWSPPVFPQVTACAELYQGWYLTLDGRYEPVQAEQILEYKKLSKYLPGISGMSMLGCPAREVPVALQPLYEKLYCWKWEISGGAAIWDNALLDGLYDLVTIHAAYASKRVSDVFCGTVYMLSPLKLGKVEASQVEYFARRGVRVSIGAMGSLGATAPVTRSGASALQLAEHMFIAHMDRALWGVGSVGGGNALAVMDMRTMAFRYGRPESNALILETGELAKRMGLPEVYHAGLTDAKAPCFEAGVQKATSALLAAMTGGHGHIAAGLLSVDEVFSPVQLALDGELCEFLNRSLQRESIGEETLALSALMEVPHGAMFLDQEHTVEHMRTSLWNPRCFSSEMFVPWMEGRRKLDADYARDLCASILLEKPPLAPAISAAEEADLIKVIHQYEK